MIYIKCFANSEIVAYAPKSAQSDHLFVYKSSKPTGELPELNLEKLIQRWNGTTRSRARRKTLDLLPRSLYFCQNFDLETIGDTLKDFPYFKQLWGKLAYWRSPVFKGGSPHALFLNGKIAEINAGKLHLMLEGDVPQSLDDFAITLDRTGTTLLLGFTKNTKGRIRLRNKVIAEANTDQLLISLESRKDFVTGSVAITTGWPKQADKNHPLEMAGFVFLTGNVPPEGEVADCDVWRGQLADEITAADGDVCTLALDPRDKPVFAHWLDGKTNSYMDFGNARLRSSFFGTQAQRFHLIQAKGGRTRLGFIFDQLLSDGTVDSRGEVIFHPEGPFQVVTDQKHRRTRGASGSRDLIVGSAATEFVDLEGVSHIYFEKGHPAFLKPYDGAPDKSILDHKGHYAITSFLSFVKGKDGIAPAYFHSQPADAPLFADETGNNEHLVRQRLPFVVSEPIPSFPFAGYKETKKDKTNPKSIFRYEATHLSVWRRLHAKRPDRLHATDASVGVTPQGLLAEISSTGSYKKLYFGNSDSLKSHPEFSISIRDGQTELNQEFQRALSGSQLFLVFDQPKEDVLQTITVAATVYIRDFRFSVQLDPVVRTKNDAAESSVLIVKYFKNKSLNDLLEDPTTWGCKKFLAPSGNERIKRLLHEGGDSKKPIPPELLAILADANWQGVLMLHLPIPDMPDVLAALRPGIVEANLNVHHFGLNVLPAQKADLHPAPKRFCSAFGLIHYSKPKEDPKSPKTIDHEPLEAGESGDPGDRQYRFVVKELEVGFSNSQVSKFSADVEVTFSHLFWDKCTTGRGKNRANDASILLRGAYERRVTPDNRTEDVFSLKTKKEYKVTFSDDSFLESITVKRAQLSVISSSRNDKDELERLKALIGIDADVIMRKDKPKIPLFKVKAIHLTNFGFEIDYAPLSKDFGFGLKADGIGADVEFDPPTGLSSILEALPVKLKGMSVAIANLLDLKALSFQPIGDIGSLFHFGLVLEVDLGSLGSLAGDLRGLRVPMIIGWRGGRFKGVAFGIQFPTFADKIDIGIQQFIRFRAKKLELSPCPETGVRKALAIRAVDAKIVMLGKEFPDAETSFAIFLRTDDPSRKVSWALGVTPNGSAIKYLGAGQRLDVVGGNPINAKDVVTTFQKNLKDGSKICEIVDLAKPTLNGWTIVAHFTAGVEVWLAVSDAQQVYGLVVALPALGEIDVLYRRVSDDLGIFSAEYTLPDALRTIQAGAASIRLPTIRLEGHTDGGWLIDCGFPWKNDFSRSCQVEVAIFVGAGGFYFGRTSALATDLLKFEGGYGFLTPDNANLKNYRALRFGFAARVGVGRSFSIGILSAEASLTIFGGIEGAAGYVGSEIDLDPPLYALRGYVGLMLDIEATVDFVIIKARAKLLAYAMVGLELRRVLAKDSAGKHYFVKLPLVVFAEVGITVEVDVEIEVGCVSVTIHLAFSTTLRIEERLGELHAEPETTIRGQRKLPELTRTATPFAWDRDFLLWPKLHDVNLFATVVPCMASASDVGEAGEHKTCAVGQMLLQMDAAPGGLSDLVQYLTGWILSSDLKIPITSKTEITLGDVTKLRAKILNQQFWVGFSDLLNIVVANQFKPILKSVNKNNSADAFASIPFWPGTSFKYIPKTRGMGAVVASAHYVTDAGNALRGDEASFADYARCVITGSLAHLQQLIVDFGASRAGGDLGRNDPARYLSWADIWTRMLTP